MQVGPGAARFKAEIHFNPQLLSEKCAPEHSDHTLTPTIHPPLAYLLTTYYLLLLTSYSRLTRYLAAHNNMVEVHKSCRAVHSEDDAKARPPCNPTRCGLQPRVREHAAPCKGVCHPV